MTRKEEAKHLVHEFMRYTPADEEFEFPYAKECALLCAAKMVETASKCKNSDVWKEKQELLAEISKLNQ